MTAGTSKVECCAIGDGATGRKFGTGGCKGRDAPAHGEDSNA